jgi:hypothetical protein
LRKEVSSKVKEAQELLVEKRTYLIRHLEQLINLREDLGKQYAKKGNLAMNEMRELVPEVENISQHKSSLFTITDIEKRNFNISVAHEEKVSEIKIRYDNISAPDKVKFHRITSDMLYSDYLGLSLKNSKLSNYAIKLEGKLR